MSKSLTERIEAFVEANPWHGDDGKFSSAKKLAKTGDGSYSGRKKYQIRRGQNGPSIRRLDNPCGRDARPKSRRRCQDGDIPRWARRRYKQDD